MPQIDLRDLPDSLFFASLPKSVRHSFLNSLRQVFLLVLLHPTRAGSLNCSFESPFTISLQWFVLTRFHDTSGVYTGDEWKCEVSCPTDLHLHHQARDL